MSMNLYWIAPNNSQEEFPYQTSTELSYAVMKAKDNNEILKLFEKDLKDSWDYYGKEHFQKIKNYLKKGYKFGIS